MLNSSYFRLDRSLLCYILGLLCKGGISVQSKNIPLLFLIRSKNMYNQTFRKINVTYICHLYLSIHKEHLIYRPCL